MTNVKALIERVDTTVRRGLEAAAGLCVSRANFGIDLEHVLFCLSENTQADLVPIYARFEVDTTRLMRELAKALDHFKTGNERKPVFSPRVPDLLSKAWVLASIDFGVDRIRSGHVLLALLESDDLAPVIKTSAPQLEKIDVHELRRSFASLVGASPEEAESLPVSGGGSSVGRSGTGALDQYTIDLTARARDGKIDPVTGRDGEIRQLADVLMRRRQNNPILTGEAGVGKTAVVEGLALRISQGDVPPGLANVALRTLDLGLLQAGAGVKGEFEGRLKSVIDDVKASSQPIILFIDEAHTLIGAGGQEGQNDAANLLKPALARGELRTIAATTWSEYKKYFEKDAALARRFQVVKVEEPSPDQAVRMLRHLIPQLERHHEVRILDQATDAAVRLSDRYLSGRQLPDKAVSVLDTACARLALNLSAPPAQLEDARRQLSALELELEVRAREQVTRATPDQGLADLERQREVTRQQVSALEARWERERELVQAIRTVRTQLEGAAPVGSGSADANERSAWLSKLAALEETLAAVQGDQPMMQAVVDAQAVADVVSAWTGIPVGKMKGAEIATVLSLEDRLAARVLGQGHALRTISERVRISRARLEDPRKPIGVFMLVGPSGVGKTETALALADALYGGEHNLITINMSEYQEAHTVSNLKGSPKGYVGYGEGGVLTEAVRRKPYSVVLLDEVEKAHPDVAELFFQVFDKGTLEDGEGRHIDFKNTVILLTSNAGTDTLMKACADEETRPEPDGLAELLRPDLLKHFPPALLGRLIIVPYFPIADSVLRAVIALQLQRVTARLRQNHKVTFAFDDGVIDAIQARCTEVDSGARNVEHIIMRALLPEISREVLGRMASGTPLESVRVGVSDSAFTFTVA